MSAGKGSVAEGRKEGSGAGQRVEERMGELNCRWDQRSRGMEVAGGGRIGIVREMVDGESVSRCQPKDGLEVMVGFGTEEISDGGRVPEWMGKWVRGYREVVGSAQRGSQGAARMKWRSAKKFEEGRWEGELEGVDEQSKVDDGGGRREGKGGKVECEGLVDREVGGVVEAGKEVGGIGRG